MRVFERALEAGDAKSQYAVIGIMTHLFCCDLPSLHRKYLDRKPLHRLYDAIYRPDFPFFAEAVIQVCYLFSNAAESGFCYEVLCSPLFEAVVRGVENREIHALYCVHTMLIAAQGEEWVKEIVARSHIREVLNVSGERTEPHCKGEMQKIQEIVAAIDEE